MPRPRLLFALCALLAGVVSTGPVPAWADITVDFGATAPSNFSGCSYTSGDSGFVCGSGATYTVDGDTLTATGYSSSNFANPAYISSITWKNSIAETSPSPLPNTPDESGLGENNLGPGNACDDDPGGGGSSTACEVGVNRALGVTSNTSIITAVTIGSVQANADQFQLFASTTTLAAGAIYLGAFSSGTCPAFDGIGSCTFMLSAASNYHSIGLVGAPGFPHGGIASDTLMTAVSIVPAPTIGQGLPTALAVGGLLLGAWVWGRKNNRYRVA